MNYPVTLHFTLKQAEAIDAALHRIDERADTLTDRLPRGYLWERQAVALLWRQLRHGMINGRKVEPSRKNN